MQPAALNDAPRLGQGAPGGGDALAAVIRRLAAARSLEEITGIVSQGVRALLHADGATFVLREGDRCYYAEEDAISPLWKGRRFPMSRCISGWCMTNRQPVSVPDIFRDGRIPVDAYRPTFVRSLAMAPVGRDEPMAAVGAYWSEPRELRPEEIEMLQAMGDAAAVSLGALQERAEPARTSPLRRALHGFVERVRRRGLRPNSPESYAFAVLCIVAATILREAIRLTGAPGLAVFSTFYPAVLLTMLVGGRRSAIVAAVLGGLTAYLLFMPPIYTFAPLTISDCLNLTLYGGACAMIILAIDRYQHAVLRLRHEDAKHLTLAREQRHRLKNAAAVVEAIVQQSLRGEPERARIINQRIRSGLASVDIEDHAAEEPISPRELLAAELQPYDLARFTLDGDDEPRLMRQARSLLALAAHELATNALKHGALSTPGGRVEVAWRADPGRLRVSWRETGGPAVTPPQKRGYGSIMLRRMIEAAKGSLALDFQPAGLRAEVALPLASPST
jgi:two-component sensor histidine kinase